MSKSRSCEYKSNLRGCYSFPLLFLFMSIIRNRVKPIIAMKSQFGLDSVCYSISAAQLIPISTLTDWLYISPSLSLTPHFTFPILMILSSIFSFSLVPILNLFVAQWCRFRYNFILFDLKLIYYDWLFMIVFYSGIEMNR